jgi:hypothetical protein
MMKCSHGDGHDRGDHEPDTEKAHDDAVMMSRVPAGHRGTVEGLVRGHVGRCYVTVICPAPSFDQMTPILGVN